MWQKSNNSNKFKTSQQISRNKRNEVELIQEYIKNDLNDITTIIEPFCGSCAISFYLWTIYGNYCEISTVLILLEAEIDQISLPHLHIWYY